MTKTIAWAFGVLVVLGLSGGGCIILKDDGNGGDGGDGTGNTGNDGGDGGSGAGTATTPGTGGGGPTSCDPDAADDECTACVKSSCCVEIEACANDPTCADLYDAYAECIWPSSSPEPSGYSTNFCKAQVGATGTHAGAFIDCYHAQCGTDANPVCGVEQPVTWEGFAAAFLEEYCSGCHFDGYEQTGLGPTDANGDPKPVANYSCDTGWLDGWSQSPSDRHPNGSFGNPGWFSWMSYENVKADGEKIRCGVQSDLPDGCDPAKFPNAKRFPPSGNDPNGAHCWWMSDGTTCAQPTDSQRAMMASWIFDGMVCNEGCDVSCSTP